VLDKQLGFDNSILRTVEEIIQGPIKEVVGHDCFVGRAGAQARIRSDVLEPLMTNTRLEPYI
jgi:hypothetical protein